MRIGRFHETWNGSQLSAERWLTAVPGFVKSPDSHGVGLEQLLNDVAVGVVEVAEEIGFGQRRQIAHAVDEELRVGDTEFLFQLSKECHCGLSPAISRKSCVEHDFRVDINGGVEPDLLLVFELDLFLVDCDAIRFGDEVLIVVLCIRLIPVVDGCSGSAVVISESY